MRLVRGLRQFSRKTGSESDSFSLFHAKTGRRPRSLQTYVRRGFFAFLGLFWVMPNDPPPHTTARREYSSGKYLPCSHSGARSR